MIGVLSGRPWGSAWDTDGGAVLLKAAERVYGLVKAFARCLSDKRAPEKIRHTLADLIGQRIFGIACGTRPSLARLPANRLWTTTASDNSGYMDTPDDAFSVFQPDCRFR